MRRTNGYDRLQTGLFNLRRLGRLVRENDWDITVTLGHRGHTVEVVAFEPGDTSKRNYGVAVDVGTTTIVAQLIDLTSGAPCGTQASYNSQIRFGEDVIARILHSAEDGGLRSCSGSSIRTSTT